jgi:hypothetical protein
MPKEMIVSTEVLQAVLNYLAERPFKETAQLIQALQNSAKPAREAEVLPEASPEV